MTGDVLILCHECDTVIAATMSGDWYVSWDHALDAHPGNRNLVFTNLIARPDALRGASVSP